MGTADLTDEQRKRAIQRIAEAAPDTVRVIVETQFHEGIPGCVAIRVTKDMDHQGPAAATVDDALLKAAAHFEGQADIARGRK